MLSNLLHEQKGQALILVALILPILLGFAALVVDVGNLYLTKAKLQNTADAAALAGARDLPTASTLKTQQFLMLKQMKSRHQIL